MPDSDLLRPFCLVVALLGCAPSSPLPRSPPAPLSARQILHPDIEAWASQVVYTRSGRYVAVADCNEDVWVWDASGRLVARHRDAGRLIAATTSDDTFVIANRDGRLRFWQWRTDTLETVDVYTALEPIVHED